MLDIKTLSIPDYEKVLEIKDKEADLHAFIAIHSTRLGPALGGLRIQPYSSPEAALSDVLRLAKAMTIKSALAKTGLGGGKSVIITKNKTNEQLLSFAQALNFLKGEYITAEDAGTTVADITLIHSATPYVAAYQSEKSSGDPSRYTGWGIFLGIQATAQTLFGTPSLKGKKICLQGLGNVGSKLIEHLYWAGAELLITDINPAKLQEMAQLYEAKIIEPSNFIKTPCDILAPCALGGVIRAEEVSQLKCLAIAGGANNQLNSQEADQKLFEKNILYAPDFVINSGGLINAAQELEPDGYHPKTARQKTEHIYHLLKEIYTLSRQLNKPTGQIAEEMAYANLNQLIGKRQTPLFRSL